MKNIIKMLLVGLSLISVNAYSAMVDGELTAGGNLSIDTPSLADATSLMLLDIGATGATGDISGIDGLSTFSGTGVSISLTSFAPVTNFFTLDGWQLDASSLYIIDQSALTLNLMGKGVLSNNSFDATDVIWSFSSSSTTSYSMTVASAVATVPVPAAVWLFGSGLLGLVGIARRKA